MLNTAEFWWTKAIDLVPEERNNPLRTQAAFRRKPKVSVSQSKTPMRSCSRVLCMGTTRSHPDNPFTSFWVFSRFGTAPGHFWAFFQCPGADLGLGLPRGIFLGCVCPGAVFVKLAKNSAPTHIAPLILFLSVTQIFLI